MILAVLGGAAVALGWAIPAGLRGGEDYRNAIFWGQTANRMVDSFAHQRPIWWYLPLVPILVAPWFLWRPFWHGVARAGILADRGGRLGLALAIVTLAAFSLISGKQVHYLVPQLPAFALVATLAIDGQQRAARPWIAAAGVAAAGVAVLVLPHVRLPQNLAALQSISPAWTLPFFALAAWLVWQPRTPDRLVPAMASSSVLMLAAMHLAFVRPLSPAYDVGPIARKLGELQAAGRPIAHDGVYHGQYQFVGRLEKPIEELSNHGEAERWISAHPDGVLVLYFRPPADPAPYSPLLSQPYRGRVAALFEAQAASAPLAAASAEDEADEPPTPPRRRPVVPR